MTTPHAAIATTSIIRAGLVAPPLVVEGYMVTTPETDHRGIVTDSDNAIFVVPVAIGGKIFRMIVDHGATGSALTDSTVHSIGIPHMFGGATRIVRLASRPGQATPIDSTADLVIHTSGRALGDSVVEYWGDFPPMILDSIRIGKSLQEHVNISMETPAVSFGPADGLLGRDMWSQFDLEFDVPARRIRVFERTSPARPGFIPVWLPQGITPDDCVRANVIGQGPGQLHFALPDTVTLPDAERRDARAALVTLARSLAVTDLELPIVVNGHPIDAEFDSGRDHTGMNWYEAHLLGLTPESSNVRREVDGVDTTYFANGIDISLNGRSLAPAEIEITDTPFTATLGGETSPQALARPWLLVGWKQFSDRDLFLSYSTGMICVARPSH